MRKTAVENAEHLARMAHEETGYGHVKHKVEKNLLVARRTPGIEDLVTIAHTGDQGDVRVAVSGIHLDFYRF